jgi:tRNA modification GTPase
MLDDTIVAISTPLGHGGLGIVRLSGTGSLPIINKIFKPKLPEKKIFPRQAILGHVINPKDQKPFEEAYVIFFPSPETYTQEDVIEMSCHGSPVILEEIVRLCCQEGARLANPGEFTLRAYINGRIDIIQAEAINDLIQASSLSQAKISFHQMEGRLSKKIRSIRTQFIHLLSQVEASIEFPDEELRISSKQIGKTLDSAIHALAALVRSYDLGRALRNGVTLAITGKPNVGKSTLFNSLLGQERAVVTPHPGTTRDYLQERIKIKDALFTITDMAGINRATHPAEKESIKKGKKIAATADGILLVFDISRPESAQDMNLAKKYQPHKIMFLFNKSDLPQKLDSQKIRASFPDTPALDISALKGTNLPTLKESLYDLFIPEKDKTEETIFHLRQKLILEEMERILTESRRLLQEGHSEEVYAEEIRKVIPLFGHLSGEIKTENIIEDIFKRFCVGK